MPPTTCLVTSALGAAAAGPCPPQWHHPPRPDRRAITVCAATLALYLLFAFPLCALCDAVGLSDGHHGGVLSLYLHVSWLCTCGYMLVSLHMRRPLAHALCSRYGGVGEFKKMQLIVPWILLTGMIFVLRSETMGEKKQGKFHATPALLFPSSMSDAGLHSTSSEEGLQLLSSLPLSFVLAFFFGSHFTFLDGSAVLQSLGCKLPLPSLWPELTPQEIVLIVGGGLALLASLAPSLLYLARDESILALLVSLLVLTVVIVYLADMRHTGSGVIVGSGAAAGGGPASGLEAPMSGRAMWRTKIGQILRTAMTHQAAVSNSPRSATAVAQLAGAAPIAPESLSLLSSSSSSSSSLAIAPPPQIFLHVHHYLWGLLLLPLLRFPCLSSQVASGCLLGVSVEGIACWGMDPLLVCKRPIEPKRNQMQTTAAEQPHVTAVGAQSGFTASSSASVPVSPTVRGLPSMLLCIVLALLTITAHVEVASAQGMINYFSSVVPPAASTYPGRFQAGVAIDSANTLWIAGGQDTSGNHYNDVWQSTDLGASWVCQSCKNSAPTANNTFAPRYDAALVTQGTTKLYLIGGFDGTTFFNEVSASTDAGVTWQTIAASNTAGFQGAPGPARAWFTSDASTLILLYGTHLWTVSADWSTYVDQGALSFGGQAVVRSQYGAQFIPSSNWLVIAGGHVEGSASTNQVWGSLLTGANPSAFSLLNASAPWSRAACLAWHWTHRAT